MGPQMQAVGIDYMGFPTGGAMTGGSFGSTSCSPTPTPAKSANQALELLSKPSVPGSLPTMRKEEALKLLSKRASKDTVRLSNARKNRQLVQAGSTAGFGMAGGGMGAIAGGAAGLAGGLALAPFSFGLSVVPAMTIGAGV